MTDNRSPRTRRIVMLLMAVAVLVPSLYGFGTKFVEFVALYRGDVEGAFAISPILNYLLASLGFLFLFLWAALGGMFRDIEQPKYTMLENEALLDRGQTQERRRDLDGLFASRASTGPGAPPLPRARIDSRTIMSTTEPTPAEYEPPDDATAEVEHRFHHYTGNRIPWYVRLLWVLFWIFAVYYVLTYLFPALRIELTSPP